MNDSIMKYDKEVIDVALEDLIALGLVECIIEDGEEKVSTHRTR